MIITAAKIETFNPCKDRIDNFKTHNPGFKGNVGDFLSLDNITYNDKIWVCMRLMTRNQKFQYAVACAESVLHIFESRRPGDTRVRDLISFMKTIPKVETMPDDTKKRLLELRFAAAYAAAYADDAAYADAAADAAAYAAAAYAAAYAAAAAAYDDAAAAAYADDAAAYAARKTQQNLNLSLIANIMENVV